VEALADAQGQNGAGTENGGHALPLSTTPAAEAGGCGGEVQPAVAAAPHAAESEVNSESAGLQRIEQDLDEARGMAGGQGDVLCCCAAAPSWRMCRCSLGLGRAG
jgi:hypothetical protein